MVTPTKSERGMRAIWIVLSVVGAIAACALLVVVVSIPMRADRNFARLSLGASRAELRDLLGEPRRRKGPEELKRYRNCEVASGAQPTEVLVFMKGIDRLYIVGLAEDRVVAKCSTAM